MKAKILAACIALLSLTVGCANTHNFTQNNARPGVELAGVLYVCEPDERMACEALDPADFSAPPVPGTRICSPDRRSWGRCFRD
jgi:hypothetical protein